MSTQLAREWAGSEWTGLACWPVSLERATGKFCYTLHLSDAERVTLTEVGYLLGRKALERVTVSAKPATIRGWYRKLIANKFHGSKTRRTQGRPWMVRSRRSARPHHEGERSVARLLVQPVSPCSCTKRSWWRGRMIDSSAGHSRRKSFGACGGRLPIPSATANCKR